MSIRTPHFLHIAAKTCKKHETRIVTMSIMVLIAVASFVMGMMTQSAVATVPLVVEYDASFAQMEIQTMKQEVSVAGSVSEAGILQECLYVGSKNSTKYYPPTCSFAKRIAPKNLRCFTSDADAHAKGYVRSTGC